MINAKGTKPNMKSKKPDVIMLNVKKLKMFRSKWPESTFAANRKPNDTARDT
jgi:hypothetical protein